MLGEKKIWKAAFENSIENKWFIFGGYLAGFGGLIGDFMSVKYLYAVPLLGAGVFFLKALSKELERARIYLKEVVPIPLVINISNKADTKNALNQLVREIEQNENYSELLKNLKKYYSFEEDDFVFHYNGDILDKERFIDFIKILGHDVKKLEKKIPQGDVFHIAYVGPIANAIAVGTAFGQEGLKIYHFERDANKYVPVIEIKDRSIKEHIPVSSFEKIVVENVKVEGNKKAVVAIKLSSHNVNLNLPEIAEYGDIYYITSPKHSGNIPTNDNWNRYVQEIYSFLNDIQTKYEEIKLAYSIPTAMGFALGTTLQNYWNIQLTHYDNKLGKYIDFIKLNEINIFF